MKHDLRWVADGRVVTGEVQLSSRLVHFEGGEMVGTLIAAVQKAAGWIESEAARVIATRPFLGDVAQRAVRADGEDADAVVKAVARVNEAPVGRDEYLRAEIAARVARRQAGQRLPVREAARLCIEIKESDRRALFELHRLVQSSFLKIKDLPESIEPQSLQ